MSVYQKLRRLPAIGGRRPSRIAVYACQMRFLMTRVALIFPELAKAKRVLPTSVLDFSSVIRYTKYPNRS